MQVPYHHVSSKSFLTEPPEQVVVMLYKILVSKCVNKLTKNHS